MTEQDIKLLLRKKYSGMQYAFMSNVASSTGWASRYADGVAVSLWPSSGFQIEGFEIKVSRADFMHEMKNMGKSSEIMQFCDRWWLVAPKGILHKDELPKTWGFLEIVNDKFFTRKPAPQLEKVQGINMGFVASLLRRATENVIPREALNSERAEIRKEFEAEKEAALNRSAGQYESLVKKIKAFEEASGIDIGGGWQGGDKIGKAVKFFMDGGFRDHHWETEKILNAIERVKEAMPFFEELTKVGAEHNKIFTKAVTPNDS